MGQLSPGQQRGEKREEMQEGEGASGHTPLARRSKQRKWLKFQVMHVAVPRTESGGGEVAQRAAKPTGLIGGAGQSRQCAHESGGVEDF